MTMKNWSSISLLLAGVGCHAVSADFVLADAVHYFSEEEPEAVSLLQMKSVASHFRANTSRVRDSPGDAERQLCPHEIEKMESMAVFGCRGTLRAESTKECSFWGEPHMSRSWVTQIEAPANSEFQTGTFDVLYKPGLFRVAAAADGSWEVQVLNCGQFASSIAARFGKTVIEIVTPASHDEGEPLKYYINGRRFQGEFPITQGDLFIDNSHRRMIADATINDAKGNRQRVEEQEGGTGACIDDPGGQMYMEIYKNPYGNINVLLQAADGSFTTQENDESSFCNVALGISWMMQGKYHEWDMVKLVSAEDSLFIGSGNEACEFCNDLGWTKAQADDLEVVKSTCAAMTPTQFSQPSVEETCQEKGIALASAEAACVHLTAHPGFFLDCQLDFCASDGNADAVANAEGEEHAENPQPICAIADDSCDPAGACCNALQDQAILDFGNVVQNNLCGDGVGAQEIRYGSVLTQQDQSMDLVVTPPVSYDCGRSTNAKNGAKTGSMGMIAIQAGTEATLKFAFVKSGTDTPASPSSVMFSFLDLDQGKKDKQRQSVEVCGAVNAIVTDNSELEQSINGNCMKYTSTTWGTGKDNPESPASLSHIQRARVVAYQVAGPSFTATLSVSKKGHNPRKFLFAGHPSVACVLK